ncbi:SIS domain-containing protein [Notoacmeibacter ruber]|uniref:SIS domain-containing protein n=1 Tax=Notoacmeibacter ruber TaxID=2670375 RepID=A0A3L7J906_9HYPH|nr:SIS domain-containing protein [Notoacmeibacter ruber]RLQ87000.1 SIS domain-containing protein [Notoacmeibacter ruber]
MFNFDPERFVRIETGACDAAKALGDLVRTLVAEGADGLFFMGSGGAGILMQPAADLMIRESAMPCYNVLCAEIVLTGHKALGAGSIVIMPSLSGTTKESIEALDYVKAKGATVITLVGHANTPLAQRADHCFVNYAQDDTSCEMFYAMSLAAALGAMNARGERDDYAALMGELDALPAQLLKIKEAFEPRAAALAREIQSDTYHIITGHGPVWTEAYYYGMCILEEMQWIRTRPVHASDFFHGTLELVEKGVSVIVFQGEDETRPLAERVVSFTKGHTDRLIVLDTREMETEGLSAELRALLAPAMLATMLERLSAHLEHLRDHPLETRRYYRRVAY